MCSRAAMLWAGVLLAVSGMFPARGGPDGKPAAVAATPGDVARRPAAPLAKAVPVAQPATDAAEDESRYTPIHEPPDSYSAQRRRGEAERRALREKLGWATLGEKARAAWKDIAVGDDQIDAAGRTVVNLAWIYAPALVDDSDRQARDLFLNVEGDLVVAGSRSTPNARVLVTEVQGAAAAADGWTENWTRNFGLGGDVPSIRATTADLYGNTYITGSNTTTGKYLLYQLSGADGTTIGSTSGFDAGGSAEGYGIAVDPVEGFIYVAGRGSGAYSSGWLARHRPDNAHTRDWIVPMPWGGGGNPALHHPLCINRRGEVFVVGFNTSRMAVTKFDPRDGSSEWTWIDTADSYGEGIDLDFDGNPCVVGLDGDGSGWKVVKFDRLTGAALWTRNRGTGNPDDIAVDPDGNVYVSGTPGTTSTYALQKLNADGQQQWFSQYGTTITGNRLIALDRLGNPYVAGGFGGADSGVDVMKFDPNDGSTVWDAFERPKANASEVNVSSNVVGVAVDANGSVYVGGYRTATPAGHTSVQEYFVIKWTQPYLFVPQHIKSNPILRVENHSLWDPGNEDLNNIHDALADLEFNLFSFKLSFLDTLVDPVTRVQVHYGVQGNGLAQGGLDFGITSPDTAKIGVNFVSSITGGTFDATLTGDLDFYAPPDGGAGMLDVGDKVPLTIVFTPDPKALELIANNTPRITAKLVSKVVGDLTLRAYANDTTLGTLLDEDLLPTPNITKMNNKELIRFDSTTYTIPLNEWYDFRAGSYPQSEFANAQVRLPKLRATSNYDVNGLLSSSISEKFVKGRVNLTNIMSFYATGGFVPSYSWEDAGTFHDFSFFVAFVQAYFRGDIAAEQDLTLELRPYVKLDFDEGGAPQRTVQLTQTGTPGHYTYEGTLDPQLAPQLPADGNIEITPTFGMKAVLTNRTGLKFGVYAGFEPIDIDVSASAAGIDLLNLDRCIACIEQDLISVLPDDSRVATALNGGKLDLVHKTYPQFTFPEEETLAPLVIVGDPNNQPLLAGASRAFAPMIIYNQRTPPTAAGFAAQVNATEPMVLYGDNFKDPSLPGFGNLRVRMRHYGRTENLALTRLNDQALLVQVPRRFFLLPGVARLWVQNAAGRSKTIEFPIEYPVPNLDNISGGIWAGDPRWSGTGLVALDGGTPGGNDTFIARRDYYTYLRSTLWSGGFLPAGNDQTTADAWYPAFKGWETGASKVPPGFPTLVALQGPDNTDEAALGRFRTGDPNGQLSYVNDGYFRSTLQEGLHRSPGFIDFALVNPSPGGGASRTRTAEVPAPRPVISELLPALVKPGTIDPNSVLRLDVRGPESVPYFPGYEVEKFGNFTPGSVVRVNGVAVTTEYVNPGLVVGVIPGSMLAAFGNRIITVQTPSGGTHYRETLRNGSGVIVFNGDVDSGGVSDPIVLEVRWPQPIVAGVSHPTIELNKPPLDPVEINGVPSPDDHNFTIVGQNFAPGCVVLWDGAVLPNATRDNEGEIRVTLAAEQVAALGTYRVEVANPPPNARTSNWVEVEVVPSAP